MSDVAAEMRRLLLDEVARLAPEDRVRLTERLALADLELFCAASGLDPETGRRALRRRRHAGRRASRVALSLLE